MAHRAAKIGSIRGGVSLLATAAMLPVSASAIAQDAGTTRPLGVAEVDAGVFSPQNPRPKVRVSEHMTVDMHLRDEDLGAVLQMLGIQAERNIVASKNIDATVTADLYGVTFYEALDAILHINGYGYVERGEFIYVYTLEDIEKIEDAERRPVAKVVQLNYLNATDAAQFVTPLLTPTIGQIKSNGDAGNFQLGDTPTGGEKFALASTLVVYDYPENIKEIEDLIKQLDTRPSQVLVEATILQTQLNEANAFGVDFSLVGDLDLGDFLGLGGPLAPVSGLRNPPNTTGNQVLDSGSAIVSTPGNTNGPGTLKIGFLGSNISVFIRLLDEVGDTTILSNPKVLALNRQPARVLVGARVGYLSTTTNDTSTTQTVEFLDTGTQLAFRPFISNDGMIRMELKPSVSEAVLRDVIDSQGVTTTIPDELTQEVTTNVLVRDGSTIVLGGLFKETMQLTRRQVPVLGDIPLIGVPFRGHDDNINRTEVIFLITPTIVSDAVLADAGQKGMQAADDAMIAAREGLLPWSRERQTAKLNVEAAELARSGDREKALWKLRRSLELNPNQPDAVRLREQLLGGIEIDWPHRSLMQDILHDGFDAGIEPLPPVAPTSRLDGSPTPTGPGASTGAPTVAGPTIPLTPSFTTAQVSTTPIPAPAQSSAKPNARDALTRIKGAATTSSWPWVGPIASPGQDLGPTP
jgi:type II secretory pathway component GspD/PulD (secretin)